MLELSVPDKVSYLQLLPDAAQCKLEMFAINLKKFKF